MSVICYCAIGVMDLSGVFCVADSGVLQDTFLWNSMGMHTCSVWFSNRYFISFLGLISDIRNRGLPIQCVPITTHPVAFTSSYLQCMLS